MSYPKISVITVSFNQGQFIRQNIESVLAQEYPNFEHIIIDGGSTDQTLEILRSYPHLNWSSQPDRGQSHALNKGFSKASGEIIAWLNTDDWYAPGVFHDIANALSQRRIVLGAAEEVDKDGGRRQIVENVERSFWDLYKYWVPYAWLAQPSVFFTRDLLEEVKLGPDTYVDEDLYFVMDIDLWLRMAMREPFSARLDRTCSYYRIYEENKTGKHPLAAQRELGRLFRRYDSILTRAERPFSFIIPTVGRDSALERTVQSLVNQSQPNLEIVLLDRGENLESSKQLREYSFEILTKYPYLCARYVRAQARDFLSALNDGAWRAAGSLIGFFSPGDEAAHDLCAQAANIFLYDWVGVALLLSDCLELKAQLSTDTRSFNPNGVFDMPLRFPRFIARKSTWLELGGFQNTAVPVLSFRQLLLRATDRSWMISVDNALSARSVNPDFAAENRCAEQYRDLMTSFLLSDLARERCEAPFSKVKEQHQIGFELPPETVAKARALLESAPQGWLTQASHFSGTAQ